MIEIYLKTNTNFNKNGDITLTPVSCIYSSKDRLITLEHDIDIIGRWKYIDYENIIAIPKNNKKQLYRIYNVVKSLNTVIAYARPVFFDLIDTIVLDSRPTNKTGQEALDDILKGTKFKGHSNISARNTAYYVRKNIVESLLSNDENSFLNKWGGEPYFDNFNIYFNDRIGSDKGVIIEFGYNLEAIEEDVNVEEVATRIIPTGYNGIMLSGSTPWVDSSNINKYVNIKTRVVNFDDVKVKENADDEGLNTIAEAREELVRRCNKLFENGIDKPKINYKISMIDLVNTVEYADYKVLEEVGEGDTVTCRVKSLNIDIKARCITLERDELTGKLISLELGNVSENFFNNQADITSRVNDILNSNNTVKAEKLEGIINALDTKFKAMRDVAQKQHTRAILFEDKVADSPTFGCMCLGTLGFEIASNFKQGTEEWEFRTFGTGQGFIADYIVAGTLKAILLESLNGNTSINLDDGTVKFKNGLIGTDTCQWDLKSQKIKGNNLLIDLLNGVIEFRKGKIVGKDCIFNLDEGTFSTSKTVNGKTYNCNIEQGRVSSNDYLSLVCENENSGGVVLEKIIKTDSGISFVSVAAYDWGISIAAPFGRKIMIQSDNTQVIGDLTVTGKIKASSVDTGVKIFNLEGDKVIYPVESGENEKQKEIIANARKLIGIPYILGGNYQPIGSDNGTDCSGLCQNAYYRSGINISRTTYTQINEGIEILEDDLQIGDLVFSYFSSPGVPEHVFLYAGKDANGNHTCIEAQQPGTNILERNFIWKSDMRARRILK